MGTQVCMGASLKCSLGNGESSLVVLPTNRVIVANMPAATVMDHLALVNILPFGMCSSMANPAVAAATTAAMGVLTSMPCIPVIASPWTPGNPTVLIGGVPVINQTSKCSCVFGGDISVETPGQQTVMV